MNDITKEYHLVKSSIHYKENNTVKVRKVTKVHLVKAELESLEVGESRTKLTLIDKHFVSSYNYYVTDYFRVTRSFDVAFNNAKKLLPEMKFRTAKGLITRIE